MSYVDDWNEQQRQVAAEWREKGRALRASLAEVRARVTTQGEELTVLSDAQGRIKDVRIASKALALGNETLQRMLLQAIQQAQAEAARQAEVVVEEIDPKAAAALRASREFVGEDEPEGE